VIIKQIDNTILEANAQLLKEKGSVFNSPDWLSLFVDALLHFGIFNGDNKLIGTFHIYKTTMQGLKVLRNAPFMPHIGLFADNPAQSVSSSISYEKDLLTQLAGTISSVPHSMITISLPFYYKDLQPFIWKEFKVVPGYTYRLKLDASEENLLANLSSNKRRALKKMEEENLRTELTTDYKLVESLVLKTFSRKNKKTEEDLLNKIFFEFANEQNSFAYITYRNNEPVSTAFCIHDSKTAYYMLGGYDQENTHYAAGVSSMWNCILEAKRRKLEVFDFEGSMIPEVEQYFRDFGGEIIPYYTINKATLPVEIYLKLKRRAYF